MNRVKTSLKNIIHATGLSRLGENPYKNGYIKENIGKSIQSLLKVLPIMGWKPVPKGIDGTQKVD
jgi:hypothetical protein